MQVYLINLDRHPERLRRMTEELRGVPFQRIAAVDGHTVPGSEHRDLSKPADAGRISKFDRACTWSHRVVWREFLAGTERFACVLEDDIHVSPDFARFIGDESWIPVGCDVLKIETAMHQVFIERVVRSGLDRSLAVLRSQHFGTAGYIVSRRGAADLLRRAEELDRSADRLVFNEEALRRHHPVYQLIPALCVQGARIRQGIVIPEMESSIQPPIPPPLPKTFLRKIKAEVTRPFRQLAALPKTLSRKLRWRERWTVIPFV
ncbi:MAG: glycosyltransferase family 25 protein [Verrucomicrobia bacterium]|nr:glycosyltransferase family 25 protein [Verrucomicrobiota bacterium]